MANALYQGFRGKLLRAVLWRAVVDQSAGLNEQGDPNVMTVVTWNAQGFWEDFTEVFRARSGIPATDSLVNIFGRSLPQGVSPNQDDKVQIPSITGPWYQIRKATVDPATALWACRSYLCATPPLPVSS